jgi:hypothetical protein
MTTTLKDVSGKLLVKDRKSNHGKRKDFYFGGSIGLNLNYTEGKKTPVFIDMVQDESGRHSAILCN